MNAPHRHGSWILNAVVAAALLAGCDKAPAGPGDVGPDGPALGKKPPAPAASGINAAGDVAGLGRKGSASNPPVPLLFPATGSTVVLPVPAKGSEGSADAVSVDRWLAGSVDGRAVVWHP